MKLSITPVSAFSDNYIWVLENHTHAVVVDPGEAAPVMRYLANKHLKLAAILLTHKHHDHVGGCDELAAIADIPVYGPSREASAHVTHPLVEGDIVRIDELDLTLSVLDLPGHTLGHIAFYNDEMLFCGDTLFSAGCGRVFEGTAEQMFNSLDKIRHLPATTRVYCGHEYTAENLVFARKVEPANAAIDARISEVAHLRQAQQPTLPSTLAVELETNPFLRWDIPQVVLAAEQYAGKALPQPHEVFATVRYWKDMT